MKKLLMIGLISLFTTIASYGETNGFWLVNENGGFTNRTDSGWKDFNFQFTIGVGSYTYYTYVDKTTTVKDMWGNSYHPVKELDESQTVPAIYGAMDMFGWSDWWKVSMGLVIFSPKEEDSLEIENVLLLTAPITLFRSSFEIGVYKDMWFDGNSARGIVLGHRF